MKWKVCNWGHLRTHNELTEPFSSEDNLSLLRASMCVISGTKRYWKLWTPAWKWKCFISVLTSSGVYCHKHCTRVKCEWSETSLLWEETAGGHNFPTQPQPHIATGYGQLSLLALASIRSCTRSIAVGKCGRCQGQPWAEAVQSVLFFPVLFCPVLFPNYLYLQKNPEDDSSGKTLSWEPGHLLLTIYTVRSIEQLLPFFNVLSQVFNSKVTSRCVGHSGSPVLYPNCFPTKDIKMENLKPSSKARQKIEEMVEKDFLEGIIKTWTPPVPLSLYVV